MIKPFLIFNSILVFLLLLVSCNRSSQIEDQSTAYHVTGSVRCDSTLLVDTLLLYVDNHDSLVVDTVVLDKDRLFSREYHTLGMDELYLCCDSGELCRFYAAAGMDVDFTLDVSKKEKNVQFQESEKDSINDWLQQKARSFASWTEFQRKDLLEELVAQKDSSLRTTLLLRDQLMSFEDSVFVRRILGGVPVIAKPQWLIRSIEYLLNEKSMEKTRARRLSACNFDIKNDSVPFVMSNSRSDYLLIYFWADYSEESVDSLKMLSKLIHDKYADKRLQFMTCCMHAPDSAWWDKQLDKQSGKHTWLKGGFSDPRVRSWNVRSVPSVLLLDMYNNQQQRDIWGEPLRKALDRLPKQISTKH